MPLKALQRLRVRLLVWDMTKILRVLLDNATMTVTWSQSQPSTLEICSSMLLKMIWSRSCRDLEQSQNADLSVIREVSVKGAFR